ncbi:hypothetical protein EOM39_01025 [Candidatus Gracilibacteria bacterium]|nr:hypothetical protein [Candidatus Gracilibacteria bacterium]
MKKLALFVVLLGFSFSGFTYAISKFNYESALGMANEYISNSSYDENWKDHNPQIVGKGKEFHTDDDNKVSYIEFKVSCDNNPDCGFVMVNFDGDDVTIPIASTSGNTPSEVLLAQNGGEEKDNKLYYFSPFDMYGENTKKDEISAIDPVENIDNQLNLDTKLTKEEKQEKRKTLKLALKEKISGMKQEVREYKNTKDFKEKRQELRNKKQAISKEEVSYKILPLVEYANAQAGSGTFGGSGYIAPSNASNTFVSGLNYSGCNGKTPCYDQVRDVNYNGQTCAVGCVPTAYAIVFGYYDRKGTFPNLITGTAPNTRNTTIDNLEKLLGQSYMSTVCDGDEGKTYETNGMSGAISYAKSKGYVNTIGTRFTTNLFSNIKTEINASRPVILGNGSHAMVGYGYYNTTDTSKQIIRLNLGYGPLYYVANAGGTIYYGSSIDFNINSLYYNKSTQPGISSLVKMIISN